MKDLERLRLIMKSLRNPENGCPWDREQTIDSIKGYTIEEAYEVVDAIEQDDMAGLCDELGDLLFHIIFYSEMADEQGFFDFDKVVKNVAEKLERRHPHVFSGKELENTEQVKKLWEEIKHQERRTRQETTAETKLLDDISKNLPAIQHAKKLQKRAATVGFDWTESAEIVAKIREELGELEQEILNQENSDGITEEMGDLLFCCINLSRHLHVDPELALRQTNEKFVKRFNFIEESLARSNKSLKEATLEEMDALWNESKSRFI
ncbi:MAG: nucleoside triphosphate pyrophosphohydrolase [Proteobacteria bacterium]|nr:nucleoside triphosphate pyrophosphohydrolase [Pseudomonadota bacterium]